MSASLVGSEMCIRDSMTTALPDHIICLINDFRFGGPDDWKNKFTRSLSEIATHNPDTYVSKYFTWCVTPAFRTLMYTIGDFIQDICGHIPSGNNTALRVRMATLVAHELVRRQVVGHNEIKHALAMVFPTKLLAYDAWLA
eukprot:583562-Alexandrium_andersonii.AAC.1